MYENQFQMIKKKIPIVGFDEYYQAGSVSVFHKMNIVATSKVLNRQYWICVCGGFRAANKYYIASRPLDNYWAPTVRSYCKNQKEMIAMLDSLKKQIDAARAAQ